MMYVLYGALGVLSLVGLVVLIAWLRPSAFVISRSRLIAASRETLFPYIDNLHTFQLWNPFRDPSPDASEEYSGPEAGPKAVFHWRSKTAGEGIMTIVDHVPNQKVEVDLEFIKPFPGHNQVEFSLVPQPGGTLVTWRMAGSYALFPKIMGIFMSMEKMIGGMFEKGLEKLDAIVAAPSK